MTTAEGNTQWGLLVGDGCGDAGVRAGDGHETADYRYRHAAFTRR